MMQILQKVRIRENFKAILEFRALRDQMLQKHLTLGPKMPNTPVQIHKMKSFRYANHLFCKRYRKMLRRVGFSL